MCFEQLWSVGAAPPGDPEAPHTPGLPSVPCYQSFFRGTSDFPGSHSAWPQHSHLTFSVCWVMGVSALYLSRLTMPQCVSCLLSLSSARPAPHHTRPVSWCQLRTEAAVSHWRSRPLVPGQASVQVSSVSLLTWVTGPPASGHSLEAILHSTQCTVQTSWWCNFDVHSLLYHILYNFQRIMKNLGEPWEL